MFTGQDFDDALDTVNDAEYGLYFDATKKNYWILNSLIKLVSTQYAGLDTQAEYDELYSLISTGNLKAATANAISIQAGGVIADYFHLLGIKPSFEVLYDGLTITSATATTPVRITFNKISSFRDKDLGLFAGSGMAIINGYRYVKQINDFTYALYDDAALTIPVIGYGLFSGTVTVKKVYNKNYATQYKSGLKGGGFHLATLYKPMFEIADSKIKLYPDDLPCLSAVVDYMKKPTGTPDLTDDVIDLELQYSLRFLQRWIDETVRLFAINSREYQAAQAQQQEASKA